MGGRWAVGIHIANLNVGHTESHQLVAQAWGLKSSTITRAGAFLLAQIVEQIASKATAVAIADLRGVAAANLGRVGEAVGVTDLGARVQPGRAIRR